jgi:photosystem II P680 reaction center D1 protein
MIKLEFSLRSYGLWPALFYSILDAQGHAIGTEADLLNRANLELRAMHAPNTHHFPLVLAGGEAIPIS